MCQRPKLCNGLGPLNLVSPEMMCVGTMACTCVYTCEQHVIKCVYIFAPVNVSVRILCVLILHRFTSIYTEVLSV